MLPSKDKERKCTRCASIKLNDAHKSTKKAPSRRTSPGVQSCIKIRRSKCITTYNERDTASLRSLGILDFRKLETKGEYEISRQCTSRFRRTQRSAFMAVAECTPASGSATRARLRTRESASCTEKSEAKLNPRSKMVAVSARKAEQYLITV